MSKYICVTCGEKINNREKHNKKCEKAVYEGDLDEV